MGGEHPVGARPRTKHLQFLKDSLHLGALRQIHVQIEKVLKLQLGQRHQLSLAERQPRRLERLLHTPSVILGRGEQLYDATKIEIDISVLCELLMGERTRKWGCGEDDGDSRDCFTVIWKEERK